MIRIFLTLTLTLALAACKNDETVAGYDGGQIWRLTELDNAPFDAPATLQFGAGGKVTGQAACNSFFSEQSKPYPWVGFGPIGSVRMMCPQMPAETAFFSALTDMTLAEVSGDMMILSNDAGRQMVFKAAQPDD